MLLAQDGTLPVVTIAVAYKVGSMHEDLDKAGLAYFLENHPKSSIIKRLIKKVKKWLRDNPWIWIVLFFAVMVIGSFVTVIIAQLNRPEIVKIH